MICAPARQRKLLVDMKGGWMQLWQIFTFISPHTLYTYIVHVIHVLYTYIYIHTCIHFRDIKVEEPHSFYISTLNSLHHAAIITSVECVRRSCCWREIVAWDKTPSVRWVFSRFGGMNCLHFQGWDQSKLVDTKAYAFLAACFSLAVRGVYSSTMKMEAWCSSENWEISRIRWTTDQKTFIVVITDEWASNSSLSLPFWKKFLKRKYTWARIGALTYTNTQFRHCLLSFRSA
jgi:hypothetical protein